MSNPFINTKQVEDLTTNEQALFRKYIGSNDDGGRLPADQMPEEIIGPIIPRHMRKEDADQVVPALGEHIYYTDFQTPGGPFDPVVSGYTVGDGMTPGGMPRIRVTGRTGNIAQGTAYADVFTTPQIPSSADANELWDVEAYAYIEDATGNNLAPSNFRLRILGDSNFVVAEQEFPGPEYDPFALGHTMVRIRGFHYYGNPGPFTLQIAQISAEEESEVQVITSAEAGVDPVILLSRIR